MNIDRKAAALGQLMYHKSFINNINRNIGVNLHIAPEEQGLLELSQIMLFVESDFVSFMGDHVEIVIAELDVLSGAAYVQIFDKLVSVQEKQLMFLDHFYKQFSRGVKFQLFEVRVKESRRHLLFPTWDDLSVHNNTTEHVGIFLLGNLLDQPDLVLIQSNGVALIAQYTSVKMLNDNNGHGFDWVEVIVDGDYFTIGAEQGDIGVGSLGHIL